MSDNPYVHDWAAILEDIANNSPYEYEVTPDGVVLSFPSNEDIPGGIFGTIRAPAEWDRITRDAHRIGVWPMRMDA